MPSLHDSPSAAGPSLACESLAVPDTCLRCGALMREDTQFRADANVYGVVQRHYLCLMGHSVYTGLSGQDFTVRTNPGGRPPGYRILKPCAWCQELFHGTTRQRYCTATCARRKDEERARLRTLAARRTGKVMTGDALRQVRAIPGRWAAVHRTPLPYAPREA